MKKKLIILVILMIVIAAASTIIFTVINKNNEADNKSASEENRLKIVTTFYPVYLIGINLFDDIEEVEVISLTDLDTGCLHDYQLTTQDMKNISMADILVINGGGMEAFMEDVTKNYPNLTIIDASNNIELNQDNSHIWLNPALYTKQIENVRDSIINYLDTKLSKNLDAAKIKQNVEFNAAAYIGKVMEVDLKLSDLEENIKRSYGDNLPKAVIFHEAFEYMATRIGLPVAYTIPLDHDTALSAEEIAKIINDVKNDGIRYLFTEEQYSDSVAKRIEAETTAKAYIIDSAVTGDGSKSSYMDAMEYNIEVLKAALFE